MSKVILNGFIVVPKAELTAVI
ncbi:antibiotic biosynthesis monooxygenase, partial [Vibrio cholerae]|nr:antibiotic biosynthesis monooxygenase [Vibrio cholerae]